MSADAIKSRVKERLQGKIDGLKADATALELNGKEYMEFKMKAAKSSRERAGKLERLVAELDRMTAEGAEGVLEALLS